MIVSRGTIADDRPLPGWGDLSLAAGLLVVAVLSGFYLDAGRPDTIEPSAWWHWLLLCSPAALVAVRRADPIVVVILATVAQAAIWVVGLPDVLLPMMVVLYTSATDGGEAGLRASIVSSAVLTVVTAIGVRIADDVTVYQVPLIALTCGTAVVLGLNAARQRSRASALAAAAAEDRVRAEHEQNQAIARERAHIGRELHDIIGHSLSVIAVRAEAADRVAERQPDAARGAVADIATAARTALSETRRVLAGLQRSSAAELAPPPDLDAACRLIEDLAATGVDASLTRTGCDEHPPSPTVAGGVYRIVQESLTNAIKHGGAGVVIQAMLSCTETSTEITIINTTNVSPSPHHLRPEARRRSVEPVGSGLTAMAERAEVLGGAFEAGRRPDGAFVVRATLPIRPQDRLARGDER